MPVARGLIMKITYQSPQGDHRGPDPNKVVVDCRSWAEFLTLAEGGVRQDCEYEGTDDNEWHGGSFEHAMTLARRGWPEGAKHVRDVVLPKVRAMAATLAPTTTWEYDVTGAMYDVGEYLSGVPECWLNCHTETQRPVVRLYVNILASHGVSTAAINARGGAVVALCMGLQAAGYVVEVAVIGGLWPQPGNRNVWIRVPLTDPHGGPLDTDRLLYALAHNSMSRQHIFGVAQRAINNADPGNVHWATCDAPEEWSDDRPGLYLDRMYYSDTNWEDPQSVNQWVDAQFEQLTKQSEGGIRQ